MIDLFRKYLDNRISRTELQELLHHFGKPGNRAELTELIKVEFAEGESPEQAELVKRLLASLDDRVLQRVRALAEEVEWRNHRRERMRSFIRYAAVLALALVTGVVLYLFRSGGHGPLAYEEQLADIRPGGNRAVMIFEDGKRIELDSSQSAVRIQDDEVRYDSGQLVAGVRVDGVAQYVTLMTPRGGQYQVTLPDGSKVWLNAASSLTYPTQFIDNHREVKLTGEAYFEIVGNKSKPFIVTNDGQRIHVLGTKFNVSAYPDEGSIATTLVEGSVRVSGTEGGSTATLKPGQQAVFEDDAINIRQVDIDYYTGWMMGRFIVNREKLSVALRQIERWYDVEFINETIKEDVKLWGTLSRNVMLSELLKTLEMSTGYIFEQDGRKVNMFPKK